MLKGFYGNEPLKTAKGQPELEASSKEKVEGEEESMTEEEDKGTEHERNVNQWMIDDVVEDLVKMELKQRDKEGDT